jgi:hypothetical protein
MIARRAWPIALLLGCGGHAGDSVRGDCIAENAPTEPFDIGDVEGLAEPAPEPGGTPMVQSPPTLADIVRECRSSGGRDCDERRFISKDAAICVAQAGGLAAGIRPWEVSLAYYANYRRVCWLITTVSDSGRDGYGGELLVLEATSGAELEHSGYQTIF